MIIEILGTGCSKCEKLQKLTEEVLKETGISATVEKVSDMQKIMGYGVMKTPAFVVDSKVKSVGRMLSKDEIKKFIQN